MLTHAIYNFLIIHDLSFQAFSFRILILIEQAQIPTNLIDAI